MGLAEATRPNPADFLREFDSKLSNFRRAWKRFFELVDKFKEDFNIRFECGNAQLTMTRELLNSDHLKICHLIISDKDQNSSNNLVVVNSLVQLHNNLFCGHIERDESADATRLDGQCGHLEWALPGEPLLSELAFKFGLNRIHHTRQREIVFDFDSIEQSLREAVTKAHKHVEWDSASSKIRLFSEATDWL